METQCPRYSTVEYGVQVSRSIKRASATCCVWGEKESRETTAELFCFASSKCQIGSKPQKLFPVSEGQIQTSSSASPSIPLSSSCTALKSLERGNEVVTVDEN